MPVGWTCTSFAARAEVLTKQASWQGLTARSGPVAASSRINMEMVFLKGYRMRRYRLLKVYRKSARLARCRRNLEGHGGKETAPIHVGVIYCGNHVDEPRVPQSCPVKRERRPALRVGAGCNRILVPGKLCSGIHCGHLCVRQWLPLE